MNWRDRMKQQIADRVYQALPRSPGYPAGAAQIAHDTGLSVSQVHDAVEYLRDDVAREDAIVSFPGRGGGYLITEDEADIRLFQSQRASFALTLLDHAYRGAIRPFLVRFVEPAQPAAAQEIRESFEQAIDRVRALVG